MRHRSPRTGPGTPSALLGVAALALVLTSGTVALSHTGAAAGTAVLQEAGHYRTIRATSPRAHAADQVPVTGRPGRAGTTTSTAPAPIGAGSPTTAPAPSTATPAVPSVTTSTSSSATPSGPVTSAPATVPSPTGSAATGSGPHGPTGSWTQVFGDEFSGSALDTSRWTALDGWTMNNVTNRASNVSVADGDLVLTLSSATEGAEIDSDPADGAGVNGFTLQVGDYVEASISFPGDGTRLYNWPAWWASGAPWPKAGEHDIAEVLGGAHTVNYHSPTGAHNQGAVPGYWGDAFHTYGLERLADHANVYWDGALVASYPTDDDGGGQALLLNVGRSGTAVTGVASQVRVDWVRAYRPAD